MSNSPKYLTTAILSVALALSCSGAVMAGKKNAFKVLHAFTSEDKKHGAEPFTGLTFDKEGNLYGTTGYYYNVAFKLSPSNHYTVIHRFNDKEGSLTSSDLLRSNSGSFYGTTNSGGDNDGILYRLTPNGKITVLHTFTYGGYDAYPVGTLARDKAGNIYGPAINDLAICNASVVYQLAADRTYTVLDILAGSSGTCPRGVTLGNAHDGPDGSVLFGTANGGDYGYGTVFKIDIGSKSVTVLHSFTGDAGGSYPGGTVVEDSKGNLYGVTGSGGESDNGTVYKVAANGTFSVLHSFAGFSASDGSEPRSKLLLSKSGMLYGTTYGGGAICDCGTVFGINTDGTGYRILHSFNADTDGDQLTSDLIEDDNHTLYGTALEDGPKGGGTVFSVQE